MRLVYSFFQKTIETASRLTETSTLILLFHRVNSRDNSSEVFFSITTQSFKEFLLKLKEFGAVFISLSDIFACDLSQKNVVLTFDDGYEDIMKIYPFLYEQKIPFTIFATVNYLNKSNYLTISQLKELSNSKLCTIGSHTISHPILRYCSQQELYHEIVDSKKILEDIIGKEINYFAYPYGSVYACSSMAIKTVSTAVYSAAFSTLNSKITRRSLEKRYFIPRINISEKSWKNLNI